jgi:glycine/D-amino acid oxidase-like deaminating enzyme
MSKLRVGTSYWLDQYTGRAPQFPAVHGRHETEVAIVGGGITGCLAAHALACAGLSVLVLEADRIGRGSTAASTALIMQEPDVDFGRMSIRYGHARTRRIWQQSRRSLQGLVALLRGGRVDADLEALPSVYWTGDRAVASDLRREVSRRRRAGIHATWLSSTALRRATGIQGAAGIMTRGNAQLDPYKACLGVALRAGKAGARVFEHSPVKRVTGGRTCVRLALDAGEIVADWAIVATGFATPEFKPLAGRFRMTNTYVIATPPIADATRRRMGLHRVMLWDTDDPYHYARWTPDRRLILGGEDELRTRVRDRRAALKQHARSLISHLVSLYPTLEGIEPEYAWEGLFATTPDGLPYIGTHRRYPRQLFALGYGGNGMTFGYMAAEILRRYVLGRETEADRFYGFGRNRR